MLPEGGDTTRPMFRYHGPTSDATQARWAAELAAIAPPSERLSWLKLVWVAGDPWAPVQRWVIYDMEPRAINPDGWYWEELAGPDPRTRGYFDVVLGRFVPSADQAIDHLTWRLYRETGCYAHPFWVCQGTTGGHRTDYNALEERMAQQAELPTAPPRLGSLCYAEPDQRTWASLRFYDRLHGAAGGLNALDAKGKAEKIQQFNAALLKEVMSHVEDQVKDTKIRNFDGCKTVYEEPEHLGSGFEAMEERFLSAT